jgi:thioesterase domain-containing protein
MTGDEIETQAAAHFQLISQITLREKPVARVFVLPALIDNDPAFDRVWDPVRETLHILRLSYLDWTELVKADTTFNTLIDHVIGQIEGESPLGNLRIMGYSIGGCLAYACARALEDKGRSVLRVAILDAAANIERVPMSRAQRLKLRLRDVAKVRFRGALASIIAKLLTREKSLPLLRRLSRFRHTPLPFDFGRYLHQKLTMQLELRVFRGWWDRMKPPESLLQAPTYVYKSEDFDDYQREDLGWESFCQDCTVIRVAGDHGSMLHTENNGPLLRSLVEVMKMDEG